jgi:hypothetical protein
VPPLVLLKLKPLMVVALAPPSESTSLAVSDSVEPPWAT